MTAQSSPTRDPFDRVHDFLVASISDEVTEQQFADFVRLLEEDDQACRLYAKYVEASILLPSILAGVSDDATGHTEQPGFPILGSDSADPFSSLLLPASPLPAVNYPTSTMLGNLFQGWSLAYLIATVVFGVGLLIGRTIPVNAPEQMARSVSPQGVPTNQPKIELVGQITGLTDCKWADLATAAIDGAHVPLGRKYALASGLMEITYDTGARVVLQGPCTYEVESRSGGFLSVGKLTARVEKKAEGGRRKADNVAILGSPIPLPPSALFSVRTPTATVTDLGTEFGVEVDASGQVDVHVFQGIVECGVPAADGVLARTIRLTEDAAVRIAPGGATIERRSANRDQFAQVKMLKRRPPLPLVAFYPFDGNARDQSGNGNDVGPAGIHGVTFVDGHEGQAARFEPGAGSFIDLPIDASPAAMPKLTWGAWVRPRTIGPNPMELLSTDIVGYGRMLTIDDRFREEDQRSGLFRFAAFLGREGLDRGVFPSSASPPRTNEWTFVAGVYDDVAHRVSLFVEEKSLQNGTGGLVMDRTLGAEFGPCSPRIRVGRHVTTDMFGAVLNDEPFDGEIDNVFIFRETLGMRELESIRTHRAAAILALAHGEPLPEEGGDAMGR